MICLVNALMANASAAAKPAKTKVVEKVIPAAESEDLEREKDEIRQVSAVHILCVKMISVGDCAYTRLVSLRTQTVLCGVVALCYQTPNKLHNSMQQSLTLTLYSSV